MTIPSEGISKIRSAVWTPNISLAWQFALTGAVVLVLGMAVIGLWVTSRIEEAVTRNAATAAALYVDSVIAPLTQEIAAQGTMGVGARLALEETLQQGVLSGQMAAFKLWKLDGTVVYSNETQLIGKTFGITEGVAAASAGNVHAEFDKLDDPENEAERRSGVPMLEIYSPIREPWSGKVIAVAEFYEPAEELRGDLSRIRVNSWFVVGLVTLAMLALLFLIVARGSKLITRQRQALNARVDELSRLVDQNRVLRLRAEQAAHRTVALNESYLRRTSAELHDGPVQLLAFASLRLDAISPATEVPEQTRAVRDALDEAIRDIRNICRGLTLPELDGLETGDVLRRAVAAHEAYARTQVVADIPQPLPPLTQPERICVYRFVQETLSNASRHAGGGGLLVRAAGRDGGLEVEVSDTGKGFDRATANKGLGLDGLAERIAGLGGRFEVDSEPGRGTRIAMYLPGGGMQ